MPIKTLIVDDEEDMRLLLRVALNAHDDITVSGEASNGAEALDRYEDLQPQVIVLDQTMPGMLGLDVVRAMHERGDEPCIVLWSSHLTCTIVHEAHGLGVIRCIQKDELGSLIEAVRDCAAA